MKALVYTGFGTPQDVLQVSDIERPVPGEKQVLVRVEASSVGYTEYMRFIEVLQGGSVPLKTKLLDGVMVKAIGKPLGSDIAGIVEEVGAGVTHVAVGDEVFGATNLVGGWAEYAVVDSEMVCHKPSALSFEEAATLPVPATVALGALRASSASLQGASVLVHGASGGVGQCCVQIAQVFGAQVDGVCSQHAMDAARAMGVSRVYDYRTDDLGTCGRTWDVILGVNGYETLGRYKSLLNDGGTYVAIGGTKQCLEAATLGKAVFAFGTKHLATVMFNSIPKELPSIKAFADSGHLKPLVDEVIPVRDIPGAIPRLIKQHPVGKVAVSTRF